MLDQVLREVEIECLPADIPRHISLDVTGLKLHDVIRVSDLPHGGRSNSSRTKTRPWRT